MKRQSDKKICKGYNFGNHIFPLILLLCIVFFFLTCLNFGKVSDIMLVVSFIVDVLGVFIGMKVNIKNSFKNAILVFLGISMIVLVVFLIKNLVDGRGKFSNENSTQLSDKTHEPEITPTPSDSGNNNGVKEFEWEKDIFMTNINESIKKILTMWCEKKGSEPGQTIPAQELNGGKYGELIARANNYYSDYEECKMPDVQWFCLKKGIENQEEANDIHECYDNIKEIGSRKLMISRIEVEENDDEGGYIKEAIKYFIKALGMAYSAKDHKYIKSLWKELANAYARWSNLSDEDEALRKRANEISIICDEMY